VLFIITFGTLSFPIRALCCGNLSKTLVSGKFRRGTSTVASGVSCRRPSLVYHTERPHLWTNTVDVARRAGRSAGDSWDSVCWQGRSYDSQPIVSGLVPPSTVFRRRIQKPGAPRFTRYLTICRKIVLSLSQDRLATVTDDVLNFFLGISSANFRTLSYNFASESYPRKALFPS